MPIFRRTATQQLVAAAAWFFVLTLLCVAQIEYLQRANRTLEEKVQGLQQKKKDASTEVANLSMKNLELCEELTHIDNLAKRMEMDKDRVLETADMELQETEVRCEKVRRKTKI